MKRPEAMCRVLNAIRKRFRSVRPATGINRADKSVQPASLVKGGSAKPAGGCPGPVGHRLSPGRAGSLVYRLEKLGRGRIALAHVRLKRAIEHPLKGFAYIVALPSGGGELIGGLLCQHLFRGQSGEGRSPQQSVVGPRGQTVQVGPLVHPFAQQLLRAGELGRAALARGAAVLSSKCQRESEVGDLQASG